MEGKRKKKKKTGKIILLCLSFVMVIVLTFSLTLAWFFDGDWASNYVTMAGSVGIQINPAYTWDPDDPADTLADPESDSKQLHFRISTNLAYPGQSIDCQASVYNNGGRSAAGGSPCYVRARFIVYTNIGVDDNGDPLPQDNVDAAMNAARLYDFLHKLIQTQNNAKLGYCWRYLRTQGTKPLSASGISTTDVDHYLEGAIVSADANAYDLGYYYLCEQNADGTAKDTLKSLGVAETAAFLWNDRFVIPWTLTNYSADKHIFVAIEFQAIQTFIPIIDNDGVISSLANNQLDSDASTPGYQVYYTSNAVQAIFNSCAFPEVSTKVNEGTPNEIDFSVGYAPQALPPNPNLTP